MSLAAVPKFGFVAWPAIRAINEHHCCCLSSVGHGCCTVFINEVSGFKPLQSKRRVELVRFIVGNGVCQGKACPWGPFEATGSPTAVDIEASNFGLGYDWRGIRGGVHHPTPGPQHV